MIGSWFEIIISHIGTEPRGYWTKYLCLRCLLGLIVPGQRPKYDVGWQVAGKKIFRLYQSRMRYVFAGWSYRMCRHLVKLASTWQVGIHVPRPVNTAPWVRATFFGVLIRSQSGNLKDDWLALQSGAELRRDPHLEWGGGHGPTEFFAVLPIDFFTLVQYHFSPFQNKKFATYPTPTLDMATPDQWTRTRTRSVFSSMGLRITGFGLQTCQLVSPEKILGWVHVWPVNSPNPNPCTYINRGLDKKTLSYFLSQPFWNLLLFVLISLLLSTPCNWVPHPLPPQTPLSHTLSTQIWPRCGLPTKIRPPCHLLTLIWSHCCLLTLIRPRCRHLTRIWLQVAVAIQIWPQADSTPPLQLKPASWIWCWECMMLEICCVVNCFWMLMSLAFWWMFFGDLG